MGATPTEGPTEGIRPDEEPVCYAGTGRQPVWVRVPPLPLVEAIRLDEEPVPKTGRGREALGRSSRPASSTTTRRDGREVKTPGPQPGERGSSPRRGTDGVRQHSSASTRRSEAVLGERDSRAESTMPGSRAGRRPVVTRKAGVRAPPWQRNARWPRIQARGCRPRDGGESPSRASIATMWSSSKRRGCRHATPAMRVRVPPTTPTTFRTRNPSEERGRACPPTSTTSSSRG